MSEMSRLLLDTTFLIDYLRDDVATVARFDRFFADGEEIFVNEIAICETRAGLGKANVPAFDAMLEPIEFVQMGPYGALMAGAWRAEARGSGRVLSLADALIAAAADSLGAAVVTRNVRDFALTPVRVESY